MSFHMYFCTLAFCSSPLRVDGTPGSHLCASSIVLPDRMGLFTRLHCDVWHYCRPDMDVQSLCQVKVRLEVQ